MHSTVFCPEDIQRAVEDISMLWCALKSLNRDMKHAAEFTSSPVQWLPVDTKGKPQMGFRTSFFSLQKRINLYCDFIFSSHCGVPLYPFGSVACNLNLEYGELEY
jgi:hypothetical protein